MDDEDLPFVFSKEHGPKEHPLLRGSPTCGSNPRLFQQAPFAPRPLTRAAAPSGAARALRALEWLMEKPPKVQPGAQGPTVAVVAHGHFLLALTGLAARRRLSLIHI